MTWEEEKKALEARFREDLAWYEREWEACRRKLEEERQEWNATRKRLLNELSQSSRKVWELKKRLEALQGLEERYSALEREVRGLRRKLAALDRPAIGRRYLEALREDLALWDELLLAEAERLQHCMLLDAVLNGHHGRRRHQGQHKADAGVTEPMGEAN